MASNELSSEDRQPKISVVIPVFNGAATISRALESILEQDYPAHEVIVIDDGSTDSTGEVVQLYEGRVSYFRQENAGPSTARNRGVERATGDWVAFLDADDWYYADRLALHAQLISAYPNLDFVIGNFDYRDAGGGLLRTSMSDAEFGRELVQQHGESGWTVIEATGIGRYISEQFSDTRTLTLPRPTFLDLGGFPQGLRICEDVVFLIRLCARSRRAGITCRSTAVYCVHDAGLIRSDRYRAQIETLRGLETLTAEMRAAPLPIRNAWTALVKKAYLNLAYYLAKEQRFGEARRCIFSSLRFKPAWSDLRHLASFVRV